MATIPATLINAPSPFILSVKIAGDNTERFQSYSGGLITFSELSGSAPQDYIVTLTKDGCTTAQSFNFACNSTVPNPFFTIGITAQPVCTNNVLTNATVQINDIENATGYKIVVNGNFLNGNSCTPLDGTWSGSTGIASLPHPPSGQSRNYTIRAFNGTDCTVWWDQNITITSPACVETPPPPASDGCNVYYNKLSGAVDEIYRLDLINQVSTKVYTATTQYTDMALNGNTYALIRYKDVAGQTSIIVDFVDALSFNKTTTTYTNSSTFDYPGLCYGDNNNLYIAGENIVRLNSNGTSTVLFQMTGFCQGDILYSASRNSFFVTINKNGVAGNGFLTEYNKDTGAVVTETALLFPAAYGLFVNNGKLFTIHSGGQICQLSAPGGSFTQLGYSVASGVTGSSQQVDCGNF